MSLHCDRWYENLTGPYPDYHFDDGDDRDDIYEGARCSRFEATEYQIVDSDGDLIDTTPSDDGPTCSEHGRRADDDYPDITFDLQERAAFFVCEECNATYHEHHAWALHDTEEHGGLHDEDEDDPLTDAAGNYVPPPRSSIFVRSRDTVSTHSTWA